MKFIRSSLGRINASKIAIVQPHGNGFNLYPIGGGELGHVDMKQSLALWENEVFLPAQPHQRGWRISILLTVPQQIAVPLIGWRHVQSEIESFTTPIFAVEESDEHAELVEDNGVFSYISYDRDEGLFVARFGSPDEAYAALRHKFGLA